MSARQSKRLAGSILSSEQAAAFWDRVDRSSTYGCWEWRGSMRPSGYGQFTARPLVLNRAAHRLAFALTHGEAPEGQVIRHLCHNKRCCRPSHLAAGTDRDNAQDGVRDGLQVRGEDSAVACITEQQARRIVDLLVDGVRHVDIAREVGTTAAIVTHISIGNSWCHIDRSRLEERRKTLGKTCSKLTLPEAQGVIGAIASGEPARSVARRLGLRLQLVCDLVRGRTYKDIDRSSIAKLLERRGKSHRRNAKLLPDEAKALVREREESGAPYTKLGPKFGVSPATARNVCIGRHYAGACS